MIHGGVHTCDIKKTSVPPQKLKPNTRKAKSKGTSQQLDDEIRSDFSRTLHFHALMDATWLKYVILFSV